MKLNTEALLAAAKQMEAAYRLDVPMTLLELHTPNEATQMVIDAFEMRVGRSFGMGVGPYGSFRQVVNYTADGRIDRSRSHYAINGRKVSGATYRRKVR